MVMSRNKHIRIGLQNPRTQIVRRSNDIAGIVRYCKMQAAQLAVLDLWRIIKILTIDIPPHRNHWRNLLQLLYHARQADITGM